MKRTIVLFLGMASGAFAWSHDGHRIVCEIAWQELKPKAKQEVSRLMAEDPDFGRFNDSCTWPDQIKSDAFWNWAKPLHYVNIEGQLGEPEVKSYDASRDCARFTDCPDGTPCPTRECVVEAITYYASVLADEHASDEDKLIALKFLGHFVGDLHQPLHAGYAHDKGGNDKRVEFFGQKTNLHKVWDQLIIRRQTNDWLSYAGELRGKIKAEQRTAWEGKDASMWANESHRLCPSIYKAIPRDGKLGQDYQKDMLPVAEEQLQKGGVRLAALLNEVFAKE